MYIKIIFAVDGMLRRIYRRKRADFPPLFHWILSATRAHGILNKQINTVVDYLISKVNHQLFLKTILGIELDTSNDFLGVEKYGRIWYTTDTITPNCFPEAVRLHY